MFGAGIISLLVVGSFMGAAYDASKEDPIWGSLAAGMVGLVVALGLKFLWGLLLPTEKAKIIVVAFRGVTLGNILAGMVHGWKRKQEG